jgi:hypothetical protein
MKALFFIILLAFIFSCKKHSKECPLQTYQIVCDERVPDAVFGGYNTGTGYYSIQANCPDDAQGEAKDMSYEFGNLYRRCRVVP